MGVAAYDPIAGWYDESVRGGTLLHEVVFPALFDLVGEVAGMRVCDLACGQGIVARQLAALGSMVVGVDISTRLLALARRYERDEPLGVAYLCDDAQALASLADATFDGVVCNMALMDIPDLAACTRAVARVLRPGGWFVCSITHPCLETALGKPRLARQPDGAVRETRSYFAQGPWRSDNPDGVRGKVDAHHRTLSAYLNTLVGAGLRLERLAEPPATARHAARVPGHRDVPAILVARCVKP